MAFVKQHLFEDEIESEEIPAASVNNGEVFTRGWVVDLILDLVGYGPERDLASLTLVEPACGEGAFLASIAERMSESCRRHGRQITDACESVKAFDLLDGNVQTSRALVAATLGKHGWTSKDANRVAAAWVTKADYLLEARSLKADVVVGNPPYIRLEEIPARRTELYRQLCSTMVGRADIYVGFYETALRSLNDGGVLAFICADRWMRNQYGRRLRDFIGNGFSMDVVLSMHDVDAFEEEVSAYPAITVLSKKRQGAAVVADTTEAFGEELAREFGVWAAKPRYRSLRRPALSAARVPHWFEGEDSWPAGSPQQIALLEELNSRFAPLESTATRTRVGIGIATGADGVFVTTDEGCVERDRLLPLTLASDLRSGSLEWSGHFLVNPWAHDGGLVDLRKFPLLAAYFDEHRELVAGRHTAKKNVHGWYRTIDKVDATLIDRPKLLFPDMKAEIHPVLDPGGLYPHHNLYYVVSETWDLELLGGLLLSRVAEMFVSAYAVKMRGGTLRFQAQYLRRIRVPEQNQISAADRKALIAAFRKRDRDTATEVALRVYGLQGLPEA